MAKMSTLYYAYKDKFKRKFKKKLVYLITLH